MKQFLVKEKRLLVKEKRLLVNKVFLKVETKLKEDEKDEKKRKWCGIRENWKKKA